MELWDDVVLASKMSNGISESATDPDKLNADWQILQIS